MGNSENGNKRIRCKIDLTSGTAEISALPEDVDAVFAKAQDLVVALAEHSKPFHTTPKASRAEAKREMATEAPNATQTLRSAPNRPTRTPGGSAGRTGRIGSFERVDLGLSEDQERALMNFYVEKKPSEQPDKVAVAMYFGEKELKRTEFTYNDIYSLMHLGGERHLPKALDVVVGRMIKDNWIARSTHGFALKFLARDHVEQKLPASS